MQSYNRGSVETCHTPWLSEEPTSLVLKCRGLSSVLWYHRPSRRPRRWRSKSCIETRMQCASEATAHTPCNSLGPWFLGGVLNAPQKPAFPPWALKQGSSSLSFGFHVGDRCSPLRSWTLQQATPATTTTTTAGDHSKHPLDNSSPSQSRHSFHGMLSSPYTNQFFWPSVPHEQSSSIK